MLKNRIIVLGLFITSSVYVYLEPNFITILFFYILTLIILMSIAHLFLASRNIVITQVLESSRVPHSTEIKYSFEIKNRSLFPYPAVKIKFKYAEDLFDNQFDELQLVLHSEESKNFDFSIFCKYRGNYHVGVDKIEVHDILNIFKINRGIRTPKVTVLPKVSIIPSNSIKPKYLFSEYDFDRSSTLDKDSIKDIRDYQKGDSLKDIHWKLYAKYDALMVKEKENSAINKSILYLDIKKLDTDFVENIIYQDKLLEVFLSIAQRLIDDDHVLDIIINDHILSESSFFTFDSIFNTTSDVQFIVKDTSDALNEFIENNYKNKNLSGIDVFIFTLEDSEELEAVLTDMVNSSMNVHLFETNPDVEENAFTSDNHINHYQLEKNSNVGDLFREVG